METNTYKSYKVVRADNASKILDFTDVDPEPRLIEHGEKDENGKKVYQPRFALNYTRYNKNGEEGSKSEARTTHWLDVPTLLALCNDMIFKKKGEMTEPGSNVYKPILSEFKGSPEGDLGLVSRVFTVTYSSHIKSGGGVEPRRTGPVYEFRFKKAPGVEGNNGQVMPAKDKPAIVDEVFALVVDAPGSADAKRVAHQIINYLNGKSAAAIMRNYFFSPIMRAINEKG